MKLFYVLQPFSHRCDVASPLLLYRHFHGECSGELHSLALKVRTDGSKTCHAMHIVVNHPHSLCVPLVIFPWTIALWNWLPRDYFPGHYNLKLFKSRINCYLPHISWASYWVNFILKKKKNLRKLIWTNPHKKKCFINLCHIRRHFRLETNLQCLLSREVQTFETRKFSNSAYLPVYVKNWKSMHREFKGDKLIFFFFFAIYFGLLA